MEHNDDIDKRIRLADAEKEAARAKIQVLTLLKGTLIRSLSMRLQNCPISLASLSLGLFSSNANSLRLEYIHSAQDTRSLDMILIRYICI